MKFNIKVSIIFVFFFQISILTAYSAEIFFVTQSGAGVHNGLSIGNAFSAAEFNTSGNWGASTGKISGGDTVYLSGTISTGLTMQGSGSSGSVITIDGASATLSGKFSAPSRSYITLQNMTWASGLSLGDYGLLSLYLSSNVTLTNITIPNLESTYGGLDLRGTSYVTVNGIVASPRYHFINMSNYGSTMAHHITLSNLNIVTTNDYMACTQRDLIYSPGANNITIEKSLLHKRWSSGADQTPQPGECTPHNDIWQTWGTGANPSISNPYNLTLRHSKLITDVNYTGNYQFLQWEGLAGEINVYGNVFIKYGTDAGGNVISLFRLISGTVNIYNNTFVQKDTAATNMLNFLEAPAGVVVNFKNNIVYNSTSSNGNMCNSSSIGAACNSGSGTLNHTYNAYYGGGSTSYLGTTCASYASTGEVCNSTPNFLDYANDDYRIGTSSPAYNTGIDLGSSYNIGLSTSSNVFPNPVLIVRPQPSVGSWGKGAYEYTSGNDMLSPKLPMPPVIKGIN